MHPQLPRSIGIERRRIAYHEISIPAALRTSIITGRSVQELYRWTRKQWGKLTENWNDGDGFVTAGRTDNVVFNEYQQTQFDRIREIKDEIKERSSRFADFRANAKRRADEEEFNRFMSDSPIRGES